MRIERRDGYVLVIGGPVPRGADAITLGPVISVRTRAAGSAYLIRHELVHVRQWRRYGPIGFAARYVADYLRHRLRGYGHWAAYRRIRFEVEADWVARRTLLHVEDAVTAEPGPTKPVH
jgi:hypothetical protein